MSVVVSDESFVCKSSTGPVSLTAGPASVRSQPTIEGRLEVFVLALPQSPHQGEQQCPHFTVHTSDQWIIIEMYISLISRTDTLTNEDLIIRVPASDSAVQQQ